MRIQANGSIELKGFRYDPARVAKRRSNAALKRLEAAIPLGRYGQPEEVAAVAVFLASDKASYVSGAVIPMDGAATPII